MRKGTDPQRFPHSANLFNFCLHVLESRRKGSKVHDQEIGNILQYNPSDTSHWKRGKKAIRSIYALEALSKSLDVNSEIIHDLADGAESEESWFDFMDAEEEHRATKSLTAPLAQLRRERQILLERVALQIQEKANINSFPIYLPEILQALPFIQMTQGDVTDKLARSSRIKTGQYCIKYRKGELRAHTRLAISREISRIILHSEREQFQIPPKSEELLFFEIMDFSSFLLLPKKALREELNKLTGKGNIIKTLAEIFWVPKSVVRNRLGNLILESAPDFVYQGEPILFRRQTNVQTKTDLDFAEDESN